MARGFGYGAGVGLLEGVQLGHGIKMNEAANVRADQQAALRRQQFDSDQDYLQERRGREGELHGAAMDEHEFKLEQRNAQQQALRFAQAVYDDKGNLKPAAKWDRAILADVGNKMALTKGFLANNPDVDPDNPLLEVVPLNTGKGEVISFRLRRTDGGAGVLTQRRSTDPDDPVVTLAPDEFVGEMEDIFAGYGIARTKKAVDPLAAEKLKHQQAIELEGVKGAIGIKRDQAKGEEDRRTEAAKGRIAAAKDTEKNLYTDLPDDVKALIGETQIDEISGKAVTILDPERTNAFLNFWKGQSGEKDPRKAAAMFKDSETINALSAEQIKAQLDADPASREYVVRLMSAEKRAELRKALTAGNPAAVGMMKSH